MDRKFASLAEGRDNNFQLIRMIAACAVIVSHSYGLQRGDWPEPLSAYGFTIGGLAVAVFFALSGFLISASFERRPSFIEFGTARILRIMPALAVVALLTAFVVGPLLTRVPPFDYLRAWHTFLYVPRVLALKGAETASLPGLFEALPSKVVNGPLWTLYYEAGCYFCLGVAGVAGLLTRRRFPFALALYALGYVALTYRAPNYAYLSLPFVIGMIVYRWRDRIPAAFAIAVGLAVIAVVATLANVLGPEARLLAVSYAGLWASQADSPLLRQYNRLGDYSYGVYIYGWPIQQMLVMADQRIAPLPLMAFAIPAAILCGAASWYIVERPALEKKHAASELARRILESIGRGAGRDARQRPRMVNNPAPDTEIAARGMPVAHGTVGKK